MYIYVIYKTCKSFRESRVFFRIFAIIWACVTTPIHTRNCYFSIWCKPKSSLGQIISMAYNFISIMGHFHSRSFKANITYKTGFDLSFWEVVVKIYPSKTLSWANKDRQKLIVRQIFPFHGIIYSSKLLKKKYYLKLPFLRPNQHLFVRIQQY